MVIRLRLCEANDAHQVAEVHVRSWKFGHEGLFTQSVIDSVTVREREASWQEMLARPMVDRMILLAEREGEVVGFASSGPSRDPLADDSTAELYELFVDPEAIGAGVGTALLSETLDRMERAGFPTVTLWVVEGNARARRFYAEQGFRPDEATKKIKMRDAEAMEVRYTTRLPRGPGW